MLTTDDRALVERAQQDNRYFEPLYRKYLVSVYNYFWFRLAFDKEIAEELTQETFVRALAALSSYSHKGHSYQTYLLTIAHNGYINYVKRRSALPLEVAEDIAADEEVFRDPFEREIVLSCLDQLTKGERDALRLRYYDDLSIAEIAMVMTRTENAVKLLLSRARKHMGGLLGSYGYER